jgi:hypothetical protein
LGDEERSTPRK